MPKKFTLKINKISKIFDEKKVLNNISFSLYFGEKIALIGPNGSGKSTLAKIITGKIKQDEGEIEIFKNFKISYLPQEINNNISVKEYLGENSLVFSELNKNGFSEEILLRKISSLSGGEKTKIFLIKIALENSPIIILDEPTNNLDSVGIKKLKLIINKSKSSFLIISHDRNFLDETVTKIIYLDEFSHEIKIYDGNYSDFFKKREKEKKRQEELYVENQKEKKKLKKELKNQISKTSRKMKTNIIRNDKNKLSANKRIEGIQNSAGKNKKRAEKKLKSFKEIKKPEYKKPLIIDFSEMKRSGLNVLKIKNLILNFGTKEKINLEVFFGDKILISGKNGIGKTTLIKEILKSKEENNEKITWGTNVNIGHLPQDLEFQNKNEIFINYFLKKSEKTLTDARKILNRFGFYNEEINLEINNLSPGMRARGRIALMLANNPNLLILDEPTNNIDLEILEEFEKALKNYKGTIIFVSHDKYFIEKIKPNKIINL